MVKEIKGKKLTIGRKKEKNNETSVDLLQSDGFDVNNIENDSKPVEFSDFDIDNEELETVTNEQSNDEIEDFEDINPVDINIKELDDDISTEDDLKSAEVSEIEEPTEFNDIPVVDSPVEENILEHSETVEPETLVVENTIQPEAKKDLNSMFERVSSNVQEAKSIFAKNVEMKAQLDEKFELLEKEKKEFDELKKSDYDKINSYKEAVTAKLKEKKNELDEQIDKLKIARAKFDSDKQKFDVLKQQEFEKVKEIKRQNRLELEEQRKELDAFELELKSKRDEIETEKHQLEIDRIKYDSDKNELANNLLKFNDLVSDFTSNMDKFN